MQLGRSLRVAQLGDQLGDQLVSAVASVGERDGSGSLDLPPPLRTRVLSRTNEKVDSIGLLVF